MILAFFRKKRPGRRSPRRRAANAAGDRHRRTFRVEPLEDRRLLAADLLLTEFMAHSDGALGDSAGDTSDWIELYNPSGETVNLLGWSLTDDASQPDKWALPYVDIDPGQYLVVFASGQDRSYDTFRLRRDFHTVADGTFLVDLDAGMYEVRLTMGDANRVRDEVAISIQNTLVDTVSVGAGEFWSGSYPAAVTAADGRLAVRLQDAGGLTGRAVINALIVTPAVILGAARSAAKRQAPPSARRRSSTPVPSQSTTVP